MKLARRVLALTFALIFALADTALAAQPPIFANAPAPKRGVVTKAADDDTLVEVEINKGKALRLPGPAASVAIANPAIADVQVVSPRLLYVNGKAVGETSLIAVDGADNIIREGTVVVTHNLTRLKHAATDMLGGEQVQAESTDNAIILSGKINSPVEAEKVQRLASSFLQNDNQKIINMLDTSASDQVMLKVKVVELARSELKRFGINWESVINSGSFLFGVARGRDIIDGSGDLIRSTDNDNSILAGFRDGTQNINAMIDALENDGLVSVLAEPNLTTRSGQTASFLAGGEIPIPVPGENGTVTIEYRQFGVSLQFTPVVLSKDKISLTVLPEVSALSEQNSITGGDFGTIPAITTRRASTTVDLGSGQTFAVAGLMRSDQNSSNSKIPILGDIPVLGSLFRTNEYENDQTELVILVTPYIVKPIDSPDKLLTPMDGYVPPTDGERILLGKLHGETPRYPDSARPNLAPAPMGGLGGQSGFLIP